MSLGGIIGGVVGGIIGYFVPVIGPLYGASIGFSLGLAIDPITPDVPVAGVPLPVGSQIMLSEIGGPLSDLVGTGQITGHLLCFGKERAEAIMTEVEGGKGGSSPDPYVSGYKYYMSWAVGIVAGPVDILYTIYRNEDIIWEGELELPVSGGQETIVIEGMGSAIFYFGTADQSANSIVGELIGDETLNSPYRKFCWCVFDDCYIGEYNRCPTMKFVLGKYPVIAFSGDNVIQTYDYNPMHAIWYVFHDLAGLPESWLHTADFLSAATVLADETRGICCLFMQQQNTLNYLETINNHIDGIIRYGSDGKFHPKLIREDYVVDDLPLIDENKMLDDPTLNRKSWIDTINEMKVQYTELLIPFPQGRWVAAQPQPGTPYVYLYDITNKAVIKLKTSTSPVVTDVLSLEPLYSLDYDKGFGGPGSQRGGYCMNKDGTRLWYLFREPPHCELIEVDISSGMMKVVKKTVFSDLVPAMSINDGRSDDTYTYWCTSLVAGRVIKIRNSDHVIVADQTFNYPIPGSGGSSEGISSIDVDKAAGKVYWFYNRDHYGCEPEYNSCAHYVISASDLTEISNDSYCGTGLSAPWWLNLLRVYPDEEFVIIDRSYHPSWGKTQCADLLLNIYEDFIDTEYLQNMFGFNNDLFFILWHVNSTDHPGYLSCVKVDLDSMVILTSKDVSYYTGQVYPPGTLNWDRTSVSALNKETGIIVIVRYHNTEERNYVASFKADSTLEFLDDTAPIVYKR